SNRLRELQLVAAGNGADLDPAIRAAGDTYGTWWTAALWALVGIGVIVGLAGAYFALSRLGPRFRARNNFEIVVQVVLIACSAVAILTTVGIVFSVLFETLRFFARYPALDFLFGLQWSPQTAIREDQVGQSGAFG